MRLKRKGIQTYCSEKHVLLLLRNFLVGRLWIKEELKFPSVIVEQALQQNLITVKQGIIFKRHKPFCQRCHNIEPQRFYTFDCSKCQKQCTYCLQCLSMKRISSCTMLVTWAKAERVKQNFLFAWRGQFSFAQQKVANELVQSVKLRRDHLVHAVCGAGKTEMMFPAIAYALEQQLRVCIATPRTDVVLELAPRLQAAFPKTYVSALYGGCKLENKYAPLVLATTHQLYRFENAFDIIFVDEADAFPYTYEKTLQKAVRKAVKKDAPQFVITATPTFKLITQYKKVGKYSFIPRRYHQYDLPVPKSCSLWGYKKQLQKGQLPLKLACWIRKNIEKKQPFLIFFPSIILMEATLPLIQKIHYKIEAVHASSEHRKKFVQQLRKKQLLGLLTTTILERGITIENLQVAIVGAEDKVFNKSALIQISGRVGRAKNYPTGEIVFFHHGQSFAMKEAIREIRFLNKVGV